MKFRVGDKVRLTEAGALYLREWASESLCFAGNEATVVELDDDDLPYRLSFANGESWWVYNDGIERVASPDDNDEITTIINDAVHARLAYGLTTHGHGVRVDDKLDWEDEALAELFDGLVYTAARLIELRRNREKRGDAK